MRQNKLKFTAKLSLFLVLFGLFTYLPALIYPERIKAKIVALALDEAVVAQRIPDFGLIKDKKQIILSTENISPNLVPKFSTLKLIPLSPQEIQKRADREGDFLRLSFNEIEVGVLKSTVTLDNTWAVSKDSKKGYLSGGGFKLTYYNIFGFWFQSPIKNMWIS